MNLIGCGNQQPIVKKEYVKQAIPALPVPPDYYEVVWQRIDELYCLTPGSAKNLLKNRELDKDFLGQHQEIIEGLR